MAGGIVLLAAAAVVLCLSPKPRQFRLTVLAGQKPIQTWTAEQANVDTLVYSVRDEYVDVVGSIQSELPTSRGWSKQTTVKETTFGRPAAMAVDNDIANVLVVPGKWTVRPESSSVEAYSKEQRRWTTVYVYHSYHPKGWLAQRWVATKRFLGIQEERR